MARSSVAPHKDHQANLNRMTPVTDQVNLGNIINDLITSVNALKVDLAAATAHIETQHDALVGHLVTAQSNLCAAIAGINAKLDLDGGVTGTDYASLWNVTATTLTGDVITTPTATSAAVTALSAR
jgi:hypothetical protein